MPVIKRQKADGTWEYIQTTGLDVSQINSEITTARGTKANLNERLDDVESQLAQTMTKLYNIEKGYGAKGDGVTDNTAAIQNAINDASVAGGAVFIPSGTFIVSDTIILKSNVTVFGVGKSSVIKANFATFKYVFEATAQLTRTLIEKLTIEAKAENLSGGIKVTSAQRGNTIQDVWFMYVSNPIYMGEQVYAIYTLRNIYAVFFSPITDSALLDQAIGIYIQGNTVMLDSVEITGNFGYGLYYDTAMLGGASNLNISGSAGYPMKRGIYIKDSQQLSFDTAWIEQIDTDNVTTFLNESIRIQGSDVISFNNMQLSNGSVFVDNSKVSFKNSKFYTADTGIRPQNGATVYADNDSYGTTNYQGDIVYQNGIIFTDQPNDSSVNILNNPLLLDGVLEPISAVNASSTLASDTTLFHSGDKSMKVTCTADYAGARVDMRNIVKNGGRYTLIARVKKVSNVKNLYTIGLSGTSTVTDYPNTAQNTGKGDEWHFVTYTFTVSDPANCYARIICLRTDTALNAVFNVDSVFLYEGNHSVSVDENVLTKSEYLKRQNLYLTTIPWGGVWKSGDYIYKSDRTVQGTTGNQYIVKGWIRLTTGSGTALNIDWAEDRALTGT